jgi:hypothetical protein
MPIKIINLSRTRLVDWLKQKNATLVIQECLGGKWRAYIDEISGTRVDVEGNTPFEAVTNYLQKLAYKAFYWRRDDARWNHPAYRNYPRLPDEAPLLTITQEELESELM